MDLMRRIELENMKTEVPDFAVGDTVHVHYLIREGDKERVQIFAGVVIGRRGHGINETFTVRRISYGEGVERVFPIHSARVEKVEVERQGSVRRAKLTYLRGRVGKSATAVKEKESHTGRIRSAAAAVARTAAANAATASAAADKKAAAEATAAAPAPAPAGTPAQA